MQAKRELEAEKVRLETISQLLKSYEEIAAMRMQRIRNNVLKSRDFLSGVDEVFREVKNSYHKEIERLMKSKKIEDPEKLSFIKNNGKTVCVLLSANTGLYGDIVKSTYDLFVETVRKENSDVVVIGRLGFAMFKNENLGKNTTFFELSDGIINPSDLSKIIEFIIQYEKVLIFHGQFQSIVSQKPATSNLSGDITAMSQSQGQTEEIKYIFEPSLETIMEIFQQQIFAAIFEQTVHESSLSKFASRMVLLDSAVENTKKNMKNVMLEKQRLRHHSMNQKQLTTLAGMSLWKKV